MNNQRLIILAIVATGFVGLAGDRRPAPDPIVPRTTPTKLIPKVQTDNYSCGYLALSAIYESHGLSPEVYRLKSRLGTEQPAIAFVSNSNGTIQPDLFRVLAQDGFAPTILFPKDSKDRDGLIAHLESGLYALALVSTERAGGLHWIVFCGYENEKVLVGDSLKKGVFSQSLDEMMDDNLIQVIALTPTEPNSGTSYRWLHVFGGVQMIRTAWEGSSVLGKILISLIGIVIARLLYLLVRKIGNRWKKAAREGI